jgi:ribosome-binding ATPase YchF (GTP1/OBG family)
MLQIGLIGKTNVGKSSFFKAATMIDVEIGDRRFVTIKPNLGIAYVIIDCVCKEFKVKCNPKNSICKDGKRYVPVRLWDVAGLVPEAHLGKGLGLQFLDDIRQASVLINVIDASGLTDEEGRPTVGYDPSKDIEFVEKEIDLWFASVIKRAIQRLEKKVLTSSKTDMIQVLSEQLSGLEVKKEHIVKALDKASISDVEKFAKELRKISKSILIAANKIDLKSAQENFEKLKDKYQNIIPTSADAEIALKRAADKGLIEYLPGDDFKIIDPTKLGDAQRKALELIKKDIIDKYGSTGIQTCLNKAVFEMLNYIAVYPVADVHKLTDKDGNVLPDVFLVPKGTTTKDLAFMVHTELGEKFICGIDARTKRRLADDYQLKNNDVVEIAFAK